MSYFYQVSVAMPAGLNWNQTERLYKFLFRTEWFQTFAEVSEVQNSLLKAYTGTGAQITLIRKPNQTESIDVVEALDFNVWKD